MREVKINFLPEQEIKKAEKLDKKEAKSEWKKIIAAFFIVAVIAAAVFSSSVVFSNESLIKDLSRLGFIGQVGKLIASADRPLAGENRDRINFLIMGIGGRGHDGPYLADTMILGSFKPSTKQVALISIPRDMFVKYPGYGWMKINEVNSYGEKLKPGLGGKITGDFLGQLLNTTIDYYAVMDFDGFEKLINEFGGVDVTVDRNLIDYEYPIIGKEDVYPISSRYEVLNIKKGFQHMDGATALKFARSRHALGIEGSDFARSRRQQKIILALKDKIMNVSTLFNPQRISSLLLTYKDHVSTNAQVWEMLRLAQLAKDVDLSQAITYGLGDGTEPLLYATSVNGAYVLLPYGGSYEKIAQLWDNIFDPAVVSELAISKKKWAEFSDLPYKPKASSAATSTASTTASTTSTTAEQTATNTPETTYTPDLSDNSAPAASQPEKTYQDEKATIEIQNGTAVNGWASQEKSRLVAKGFKIAAIGNAPTKDYIAFKIYDLAKGKNPLTSQELQSIYGVTPSNSLPAGLSSNADFLIILGK